MMSALSEDEKQVDVLAERALLIEQGAICLAGIDATPLCQTASVPYQVRPLQARQVLQARHLQIRQRRPLSVDSCASLPVAFQTRA
jgi:hypothetical protein